MENNEFAPANIAEIEKRIADGLIKKTIHPSGELVIYNYTPKCQYSRAWDEYTMMCRGLICDLDGHIIARPFKKFFNLDEPVDGRVPSIPDERFMVHEKLDGSLGIMYWWRGVPFIATRGSFTSDMAIEGTKMLWKYLGLETDYVEDCIYNKANPVKYPADECEFDPGMTCLFEVIYPGNRIVVDYGDNRRLVLLAVIDTLTASELPVDLYSYPDKAQSHDIETIDDLEKVAADNAEGFVVHFSGGLRLKFKFEEYKRLHRILTGVSNKDVWKIVATEAMAKHLGKPIGGRKGVSQIDAKWLALFLSPGISQTDIENILADNGKSMERLLDRVPDEFYQWLQSTVASVKAQYEATMSAARGLVEDYEDGKLTPKDIVQTGKTGGVALQMIAGKLPAAEGIAWQTGRPAWERPFSIDADA